MSARVGTLCLGSAGRPGAAMRNAHTVSGSASAPRRQPWRSALKVAPRFTEIRCLTTIWGHLQATPRAGLGQLLCFERWRRGCFSTHRLSLMSAPCCAADLAPSQAHAHAGPWIVRAPFTTTRHVAAIARQCNRHGPVRRAWELSHDDGHCNSGSAGVPAIRTSTQQLEP